MKTGFTCGAFDLCHAGHCLLLKEAKQNCDYLIVGLQVDPSFDRKHKHRPVQSMKERRIQLESCKYVDEIIEYYTENDLYAWLIRNRPDIRFHGNDHENKFFTGFDIPMEQYFVDRCHGWSTTELRQRVIKSK